MVVDKRALDSLDIFNADRYVAEGYPWQDWDVLRREAPVFWYERPDTPPFWAITKHEDILRISKDPKTFMSGHGVVAGVGAEGTPEEQAEMRRRMEEQAQATVGDGDYGDSAGGHMILNMDPPEHGVYRNLVVRNFTPRALGLLEPRIDELSGKYVDEVTKVLVDQIAEKGECDFVTDLAAKLPLAVICEMMGIPRDDWDQVFDWTNRAIGSADPEYQQENDDGGASMMGLLGYFGDLLKERRAAGGVGEDLIASLMQAEIDGKKLDDGDIISYCFLLIIAGNETTRNATTGGMLALIQHPEQRAILRNDLSLIPSAVEEMLRWASPLIHFIRVCTVDTEIRGQLVKAGQSVMMFYPSANRDEEVFPDPYTFDITRDPNDHLAFGGFGEHFCLGANLARRELQSVFRELLTRVPDLQLVGEPQRLRSLLVGGIKHMKVEYTPS